MNVTTEGDDPRLYDLLLRWKELRDLGRDPSAEELCSDCPELAGELARRIAMLRRPAPIADGATPVARGGDGAPGRASARAEFRDLRFHAAGGLGVVYTARNAELNRHVALKFLKPERSCDADSRRRFLQEAEVTGRLEHPGVVPIYALGTDAAGSPCYAMRFIRGETLQDAIDAFHSAEKPGRAPSERRLALRELLGRFVSICNTIGYAHSRGILHRDLKPRNIMLGKYGETLVVDWGLAKPFDRDEAAREIGEETLRPGAPTDDDSAETPTVGVVGTPAYMSPEQAEAQWDLVGPASDIFALGGLLYAILTGKAPYGGKKIDEIMERVRRCAFPAPRQVKPDLPRALEAICLKAMAKRPEDRYANALELAGDMKRWLADEPVSAWREPVSVRARRWMRRHRSLVTAAAAAVLVGLVALGIGYAHESAINRRLDDANRQLTAKNEELEQARARLARSKAETDRWLDQSFKAIEDYYTGVNEEFLLGSKEFEALRARLVEKPRQFYEQMTRELEATPSPDDRTRAWLARGRFGLARMLDRLGRKDESRANSQAAIALHHELIAAHPEAVAYRDDLARSLNSLGVSLRDMGQHRAATDAFREAKDLLTRLADEPSNRSARLELLSDIQNNLAIVFENRGEFAAAAASVREGIAIRTGLVSGHPEVPDYRHQLANEFNTLSNILREKGDLEGAAESARKAIDLEARLTAEHPEKPEYARGLAYGHGSLGIVYNEKAAYRASADEHRRAIEIEARLLAQYPNVPVYEHSLAMSYNNLGTDLDMLGDLTGAADAYREGIAIRARLASRNPGLTDNRRGLANKTNNLGIVLLKMRDLPGATAAFRASIAAWRRLADDHPDIPDYRHGLARALDNLGGALNAAREHSAAAGAHREAIAIETKVLSAHPSDLESLSALGRSNYHLAEVAYSLRRPEEAIRHLREAIAPERRALELAPGSGKIRQPLVTHHLMLAALLRSLGRVDEAIAEAKQLLTLAPDRSVGLYSLACQLALCAPIPRDAARRRGLADEAMATLRSAVAAGFRNPSHASRNPDLAALRGRDDFRRLLVELFDRAFPPDPFAP